MRQIIVSSTKHTPFSSWKLLSHPFELGLQFFQDRKVLGIVMGFCLQTVQVFADREGEGACGT